MTDPIRIADHDYLSAPTDDPANARWEGVIGPAGITTIAQLGFWPWGSEPAQATAAQLTVMDAGGLLDGAVKGDLSGQPVELLQVERDGALADAVPVARFVLDRILVPNDGNKTFQFRDGHDNLDKIINPSVFADDVDGRAGQVQPMSIGAVFNAPVLLTGSDGSVGWLADAPQSVAVLRDRGDAMEPGTWSMDAYDQQVLLESPPLGPMTSDLSSIGLDDGEPVPATLDDAIREVARRCDETAWSSSDAVAIDTETGYAGIGLYAGSQITGRAALASILRNYGAWYWQDGAGVLRWARVIDPETVDADFEIGGYDMAEDLSFSVDSAPGLTTRMAWRPNASELRDSDLVTDLVDVPAELRARLCAPYAGVCTAAGADTLPAEYRHALDADPFVSLFWLAEDAQAEIDRVVGLYQQIRCFLQVRLRGEFNLAPTPGQVCQLAYPRYGLTAGTKLLVCRVDRNPVTGDLTLKLWG